MTAVASTISMPDSSSCRSPNGRLWAKGPSVGDTGRRGNPTYGLARFDLDTREFTYVADALTMWRHAQPFATDDALWLYRRDDSGRVESSVVDRFDLQLLEVTDTLDTSWGIEDAVVSEDAIWLPEDGSIHRIEASSRERH